MGQYKQWEIWKARVYHDDDNGFENRPVVVISEDELIVLALKITTHGHSGKVRSLEYEIFDLEPTGLDKGSVIQCDKYHRLPKANMSDIRYGRLSSADIVHLQVLMKYHGLLQ